MAQSAPGPQRSSSARTPLTPAACTPDRLSLRPEPKPLLFALLCPLFTLLLALLFTGTLAAAASPPPRDAKSSPHRGAVTGQTLTIRGSVYDLTRPYITRAIARYQTLTGNTVRTETFSHAALDENLRNAFIHGTADRPDILHTFGGVNLARLHPADNFYDFTAAPWVEDVTDTALSHAILQSRVYGLPFGELAISGILYNKKLFSDLGLALPRNQQEFFAVCSALQQNGIIPLYIPFAEPTMLLFQFPLDSVVNNPQVLNALNSGTLRYQDMDEMREIVQWYKRMADSGYFGAAYADNNWNGMDSAMKSRRYAMMICWDTWLYTNFTGNPREFGLMPAFMGVPEQGTFEGPNPGLFVVDKKSPNLAAALDFIAFLASPPTYNDAFSNVYTAPAFRNQTGGITTPQYLDAEHRIEQLMNPPVAWLHIRGFSQLDAVYIQKHILDPAYTVEDCLKDMDKARINRALSQE